MGHYQISAHSKAYKASKVWVPKADGLTVLQFLCGRFPHVSEQEWIARLDNGWVRFIDSNQNANVLSVHDACPQMVHIEYFRHSALEPEVPFEAEIIFENNNFVIADKPHFLPVAPAGAFVHQTLQSRLQKQLNCPNLQVAHRLDRETAGLVLLVKNTEHRNIYQALFREQHIRKIYEAVAPYRSDLQYPLLHQSYLAASGQFFLQSELHHQTTDMLSDHLFNSTSEIDLICVLSDEKALYRLTPKTGKKHQLRVHMASLNMAIEGDQFYPVAKAQNLNDFSQPLQLLARSLAFKDPLSGQDMEFLSRRQLQTVASLELRPSSVV